MVQNRKTRAYGLMSLFWEYQIFAFSAETGSASGSRSRAVAQVLCNVAEFLSGKPSDVEETLLFISHIIRKCAHMAEFAVLAVLVFMLIKSLKNKKMPYSALFTTVFSAAADEFHQMFVPGRGSAVSDVMIDSCGAAIGIIVLMLIQKKSTGGYHFEI